MKLDFFRGGGGGKCKVDSFSDCLGWRKFFMKTRILIDFDGIWPRVSEIGWALV